MTDFIYPTAFCSWQPPRGARCEELAVARVFASGRFTIGPQVEAFQAELAAYHGRRYAVCCNSGSSANLLAVAALAEVPFGIRAPVVPAVAWSTTYAPFQQHAEIAQVLDVDDTWNVPPQEHRATTIIATCPVLGNAAYSTDWRTHCRAQGVFQIEDGCESAGARDERGRLVGSFGLISTGSGYWSHQISCIEMGWALTDDADLARRMRLLRDHGNAGWSDPSFEGHYRFKTFGYNLRPLELHAAIGREQLKKLDDGNQERRKNLAEFADLTQGLPIILPRFRGTPAPFGLAFEVEDTARRPVLAEAFRNAGIDCRLPTGGSFTLHPYGAPWRADNPTPRADRIHRRGMFLGNAPWPISDLIESAVKVMKSVL
jgi:CDP-6-deoxy-D-xylo-4-hexulose-3-dehydrase